LMPRPAESAYHSDLDEKGASGALKDPFRHDHGGLAVR
jgi:hypothetical protein